MAIKSEPRDGRRDTDKATEETAEKARAGPKKKPTAATKKGSGGKAAGISGKEANPRTGKKLMRKQKIPIAI
jgi:Acetylglutamate kinase